MSTHFYVKFMENNEKIAVRAIKSDKKDAFVYFLLKNCRRRIIAAEFRNTYFDVFCGGKKH